MIDRTELIKLAAKALDGYVDFKVLAEKLLRNAPLWAKWVGHFAGKQIEKRDDEIAEWVISELYVRTPDEIHDEIDALLNAFVNKDLDGLRDSMSDRLVLAIKTPAGDAVEGIVIKNLMNIFIELIEHFLREEKAAGSVGGGGSGDDPTDPDEND